MAHLLRDGSSTVDRRLDRIVQFDDRSRGFPVRELLANTAVQQVVTRRWGLPYGAPVLDQGEEGACVGFGVTNELRHYPVPVKGLDATFARDTIYFGAQRRDPWPGGSYPDASPEYEGTSVLAGVQEAAARGYYKEYRWAFSEQDMALAVSTLGPVIIGTNWHEKMINPDVRGFLRPTGPIIGGHCVLVIAISAAYGYYTIHNSWGPDWGNNGTAKISRDDMTRLLAEDGEACVITQRSVPSPA